MRGMMLIGGELVPSESGQWLESVNPATEETLGHVPQGTAADVSRAVAGGIDHERPVQSAPVTAAQHHRRLAEIAQHPGQRQHRRGLAGAAKMIIADTKNRNAGVKPPALQPLRRDRAIERAERP